ncbi:hypothetical protein KIN20_026527 [Parelaphostrongylus tenuis]|uniref:Uncharacterized protein n=1 Tax=Parelaphostrongylus tenuis TaxID=148309 RepID=A0AAD5QY59_PARTN|nr:hypothetical protein KIN20_026527 [Parelaphostrongylus tenuis]
MDGSECGVSLHCVLKVLRSDLNRGKHPTLSFTFRIVEAYLPRNQNYSFLGRIVACERYEATTATPQRFVTNLIEPQLNFTAVA